MSPKLIFAAVLAVILAIVFYFTTYVIDEGKQAVITQFGKPVNFVTEPGLKFRIPLIQSVQKLEKRLLPWDGAPENMLIRSRRDREKQFDRSCSDFERP